MGVIERALLGWNAVLGGCNAPEYQHPMVKNGEPAVAEKTAPG
jgi:hypothetical protein